MKRIDTASWKCFRIGDLFKKLELKHVAGRDFDKAKDISKTQSEEYDLPLVNAKHDNNGIMYYGRSSDWDSEEMTIDIVADGAASTGDVYAQPQRTGVLYNAYLIKPLWEGLTKEVLLFFATVIQKCVKDHFGYENKCIWSRLCEENISIPSTPDGKPDFVYMDNYMKEILKESKKKLQKMNRIKLESLDETGPNDSRHIIDISKWRYYHLYDKNLFSINSGTKLDKVKMTCFNPSVNFVGRANANNGVTDYIDEISGLKPYDAGLLTVSLGGEYLGSCFVQDKPFYTSQNVNVLIPRHKMSFYTKLFISTVIFREGRLHYKAFVDELNRHIKRDFAIPLPSLPDGSPDFDYMDSFIKDRMNSVTSFLSMLEEIE